jgi:hypothetical protein
VDFYLYFPQRRSAEKAVSLLRDAGWTVENRLGADNENWLVKATREVPDADLDAVEAGMAEIASSFGGEYEGFERNV